MIIIPARYNSTRLPGKPLLDINGKSLIQHVYEKAIKSKAREVIIATDDNRIEQAALNFGAQVCMTRNDHPSGTDRLAEVVTSLGLKEDEIVVNLQGDEPMMPASLLEQVASSLQTSSNAAMSTLCEKIESVEELFDPNIVKVVFDQMGYALYFSRAPIPWERGKFDQKATNIDQTVKSCYRHIGLYAYRADFLKKYPQLAVCQMEQQEALEQLRAMYYGYRIHVDVAKEDAGLGIDTQEDLEKVRKVL